MGRELTSPEKANITAERNIHNIKLFHRSMLNDEIMNELMDKHSIDFELYDRSIGLK